MNAIYVILGIGLALWVYSDAKKFRDKGVPVVPGLWSALIVFFSVPLFIVYMLYRTFSLKPKSKQANLQPLPPAPWWTRWILSLTLLVIIGGIVVATVFLRLFG